VEVIIKVILYKKTGKIEEIEAQNMYHAQGILALGFLMCDEKGKSDIVFGRIETGKIDDKVIFAFRNKKTLVIRNATDEFIRTAYKTKHASS